MKTTSSTSQRRRFLKFAGLGALTVSGASAAASSARAFATTCASGPNTLSSSAAAVRRPAQTLITDEFVRRAMAQDFGHFVHKLPSMVLFPNSAADVQNAIIDANLRGLKVAVRGAGGAAYGQSQVENGIVISTSSMKEVTWISTDEIEVQPGALWADIATFTLAKEMIPPVLPDTMFISAGGTLNAGGFGETSYRLGAQIDNILELDVVTGAGDLVTCSDRLNAELFNMCLGGMGQCGIIVAIRMRVLPAPASSIVSVRTFRYASADHATYLADLALIAQTEDSGAIGGHLVRGANGSWTYVLEVSTWGASTVPAWLGSVRGKLDPIVKQWSFNAYFHRNTKGYLAAVASGAVNVSHPYFSFFLSDSETPAMIDYLLSGIDVALGAMRIALFPVVTAKYGRPLHPMPKSKVAFHLRVYRICAVEGSPDHLKMLKTNQDDLLPKVLANGGTVYLPFSPLLDRSQLESHFGTATLSRFENAKKLYDPKRLLNEGAGIF